MAWMAIILISVVVVGSSVYLYARRKKNKEQSGADAFIEKWRLPEPGGDFRLYRRVKELLDELEAERDEARLERDVARRAYEGALAEQNRLASKLESAQDMLRSWMHPKMEIRLRERTPERRQIQWIL